MTLPSITRRVTMAPFIGTARLQVIATGPGLSIESHIVKNGTERNALSVWLFQALSAVTVVTVGRPPGPAGPCGPVGPWAPVSPLSPFGPCAPVSPFGPAGP